MPNYNIRKINDAVQVSYNGEPIQLAPRLTILIRIFDYGDNNDAAKNLAYALLLHCYGEGSEHVAEAHAAGVALNFLRTDAVEFEIGRDELVALVDQELQLGMHVQQAMWQPIPR